MVEQASGSERRIQFVTNFYDENGKSTFRFSINIYYIDSSAVEQINKINSVTDTTGRTTQTETLLSYRYIDLAKKLYMDYQTFADTAKPITKQLLPDSGMRDYGWSFYTDKTLKVQESSYHPLSDTIIDNLKYQRIRFNLTNEDPEEMYTVAHLQCEIKDQLFSIIKTISKKNNCCVTKIYSYRTGKTTPFASQEVIFLSDTLTSNELNVISTWQKNARTSQR